MKDSRASFPRLLQPLFFWAATLLACGSQAQPADFVLRNANVLTVDSHFSHSQAVAIRGDKIVAVGRDRDIAKYVGSATRVLDVHGKTILPGLYDSHVHSFRASVSELN